MKRIQTIALIVSFLFLLPSCGSKQPVRAREVVQERIETIEKRIKKTIKDDQLEDHLLVLASEDQLTTLKLQQSFVDLQRDMRDNPDYTTEQLDNRVGEYREARKNIFFEKAAVRMEMRRLLTEEQWSLIFPPKSPEKGGEES